jgi:hypothetical protein
MGDTMKKVRSGDPLDIPAQTFNTFIDSARDLLDRQNQIRRTGLRDTRHSGIVLVKNASGEDRERFHVLGIKETIITPSDNEDEFKNKVALSGETPTEEDHRGKFVVLLEPLKTDAIGMGMALGLCPVKITVENEDHAFADVNDGKAATLKSASTGAAQILWKEDGTGEKWAVVRLGTPPGLPPIYKATADQSGTTVEAKLLKADGSLADGDAEELDVYSNAWPARTDDLLILTRDADGKPVVLPIHGNDNAFNVPAGSGDTADTTTWDIAAQPSGYAGVRVEQWFRLYWSGSSGDSVYQFVREAKYDSRGALIYVGPEVRSVAFGTGSCED